MGNREILKSYNCVLYCGKSWNSQSFFAIMELGAHSNAATLDRERSIPPKSTPTRPRSSLHSCGMLYSTSHTAGSLYLEMWEAEVQSIAPASLCLRIGSSPVILKRQLRACPAHRVELIRNQAEAVYSMLSSNRILRGLFVRICFQLVETTRGVSLSC